MLFSRSKFESLASSLGLKILVWRNPPRNNTCLGDVARGSEPVISQVFVTCQQDDLSQEQVDRKLFTLRKMATHTIPESGVRFYICSLSTKTIVYKGQFDPCQLWQYYLDLTDTSLVTHLCIVHTRFSTNTFPSWERAHPMRFLAHNGKITSS